MCTHTSCDDIFIFIFFLLSISITDRQRWQIQALLPMQLLCFSSVAASITLKICNHYIKACFCKATVIL